MSILKGTSILITSGGANMEIITEKHAQQVDQFVKLVEENQHLVEGLLMAVKKAKF